jgi:catechol 2,3-dioxygenase-like lactoylglutathione lyase family enzyme
MGRMTVTGRLELVAFDAPDTEKLAAFYTELAGWELVRNDGGWITLRTGDGHEVAFQPAPDHVAPQWPGQDLPQQFHLDLLIDGYKEAAERAVALGATRLAEGASWITLADPAGHPFDLCQRDGVGPAMGLYAVTIDAPDASALARFYADLLGMEVTYDGPEGALIVGNDKSVMFQQVSEYTPPEWQDPARPQQAHLDILVDDLDAAEARALELGATRLDDGGQTWRTFADPAGHPCDLPLSRSGRGARAGSPTRCRAPPRTPETPRNRRGRTSSRRRPSPRHGPRRRRSERRRRPASRRCRC